MDKDRRGIEVEVTKTEDGVYELGVNNKPIGEYILDADGYYYFWLKWGIAGSWNSNALRLIADEMDKLNKNFDKHLTKYINDESLQK